MGKDGVEPAMLDRCQRGCPLWSALNLRAIVFFLLVSMFFFVPSYNSFFFIIIKMQLANANIGNWCCFVIICLSFIIFLFLTF